MSVILTPSPKKKKKTKRILSKQIRRQVGVFRERIGKGGCGAYNEEVWIAFCLISKSLSLSRQ